MFPNLARQLAVLESFQLDSSEYLITGSGVLAIHGIRDSRDLDVLCSSKLAEELRHRFPEAPRKVLPSYEAIFIEGIDFKFNFSEVDSPWSTDQQIAEADLIGGKRYQTLERIKFFKRLKNRPKDIEDIQMIEA